MEMLAIIFSLPYALLMWRSVTVDVWLHVKLIHYFQYGVLCYCLYVHGIWVREASNNKWYF